MAKLKTWQEIGFADKAVDAMGYPSCYILQEAAMIWNVRQVVTGLFGQATDQARAQN